MRFLAALLLCLFAFTGAAQAKPPAVSSRVDCFTDRGYGTCGGGGAGQWYEGAYEARSAAKTKAAKAKKRGRIRGGDYFISKVLAQAAQILPHPSGCPSRAFCGCGASIEVFGYAKRELYLAANWLKFPRAYPAPGMAAARRGHVFIIRQVLGNGRVIAYDANSGGRQTRIHERSLAGFTVVDPRGA